MHELFRQMPGLVFLAMLGLSLTMTSAAVALGWYAQRAAVRRRAPGAPKGPAEDALGAGITVAVVPFGCGIFMLWARFG
jgi:hypothetical protein